ncbi:hypothetical protein J2Y67_000667 [Neobacillus niacini]|nr:hypothetical protein [Neobacillus niacini]
MPCENGLHRGDEGRKRRIPVKTSFIEGVKAENGGSL